MNKLFLFWIYIAVCSSEKLKAISDIVNIRDNSGLRVTYGSKEVQFGEEFTPSAVKSAPALSWPASQDEFYLMCLIDPDAPSHQNPSAKNWLHWLVGNIPGNNINKGQTLAEYVGAGPPKGTGLHRYIFLLFKQPSKIQYTEELIKDTSSGGRAKFSVEDFVKKYHIQPAVAGNYFVAQWDSYVPQLHRQLSG